MDAMIEEPELSNRQKGILSVFIVLVSFLLIIIIAVKDSTMAKEEISIPCFGCTHQERCAKRFLACYDFSVFVHQNEPFSTTSRIKYYDTAEKSRVPNRAMYRHALS